MPLLRFLDSVGSHHRACLQGRMIASLLSPVVVGTSLATNVDEKENWPGLVVLTSIFSVELPGIEPGA
jgi:hypothetical protein